MTRTAGGERITAGGSAWRYGAAPSVVTTLGYHVWGCDNPCYYGHGVSFLNNTGSGTYGYGIVLDGMWNATVQGNSLSMTPWASVNCGWGYYFREGGHATPGAGGFQAGLEERGEQHFTGLLACIGPVSER